MAEPEQSLLHVVGIPGSLRRASLNRALLCSARELAPPTLRIHVEELHDIPMFNADLEESEPPDSVARLRSAVGAADGLLLVTPEYNHGVPGVMKNAIDWLSQPLHRSVLEDKPTAIMGASTGAAGTARGQSQLRQAFVLTNTPTMLRPEVLVGRAHEKFDATGRLIDAGTRQFLADFLVRFATWIRQQQWAVGIQSEPPTASQRDDRPQPALRILRSLG
jgi:chromate reductase